MKPRIFLTGSTSFLGAKFIELYGDRFEILGTARSDKDNPLDLLDYGSLETMFSAFRPDVIIHTAADVDRDNNAGNKILETNPAITRNILDLTTSTNTTFIFTSTEAVYGGKEQTGEYTENDPYNPRSDYGKSKVESEKLIISSGLPYLITRGHRYVGMSKNFTRPKQFPDTIRTLSANKIVHLDSKKLFKPTFIDNLCDVFAHYISNDLDKQVTINVGVDKSTTYYDFIMDLAKEFGIDKTLIEPDGDETGWPQNSTLGLSKMHKLGYPTVSYIKMLQIIKSSYLLGAPRLEDKPLG